VSSDGVDLVMDVFFASRVEGGARPRLTDAAPGKPIDWEAQSQAVREALAADCDEVMLDRKASSSE
jgi:hypothetical protein